MDDIVIQLQSEKILDADAGMELPQCGDLRFHAGELAIATGWRAGQVALIGISTLSLSVWQTFLLLSILFHHSNVRLAPDFERLLGRVVVTPRMHGIHHSTIRAERDSNFSSGLTAWDYLHGTLRRDVPQEDITIGVPPYDDRRKVTLGKTLLLPLITARYQQKPRLPTYMPW